MAEIPFAALQPTVDAIYRVYADRPDPERTYLGMSVLGDPCERKLWYGFRWAYAPEAFDGRMLRLFDSGHREEARLIADLEAAGCAFDRPADSGQWAVSTIGGHVRGHLDGIVTGLREAPKARHVFEAKTHNAKSFKALMTSGVAAAKPRHYAQMQGYMHLMGIDRAAYFAVEKDTDQIHLERVRYDPTAAVMLMAKAERIVSTERPPAKLHENPGARMAFDCRYCPALAGCHRGAWARRNCRTCLHVTPSLDGADGEWWCERNRIVLGVEAQRVGCGAHRFLPDLVPGRQIDADPEAETVTYDLAAGGTWVDDGRATV